MHKSLIIFLIFLISYPISAFSQRKQERFEHLSSKDGLSQSKVQSIHQDSKGFMWFATEDGLNKYDGYRFTIYRHSISDSNSIADNFVYCIYEDRNNELWIGSNNGGLTKFNRQNETFTSYQHDPLNKASISNNDVQCIFEDSDGTLWIGTATGGLNKFNREQKTFEHYLSDPENPKSISSNNVQSIVEDKNKMIWIGTIKGVNKFNKQKEEFTPFYHMPNNPKSISNNVVMKLLTDRNGYLWCGTENGLNRMNTDNKEFTHYLYNSKEEDISSSIRISSMLEDHLGRLWIGTDTHGLFQYTNKGVKLKNWKQDPLDPFSIGDNNIASLYEDKSGVIWIGTSTKGISKYNPQKNNFEHYKSKPGASDHLNSNIIRCFYEDSLERLWIGTSGGGVNVLNRKTGTFKHYTPNPDNPASINGKNITSIARDNYGSIWIGTWNRGLNRLDNKDQKLEISPADKFRHYTHNPDIKNSISNNVIQVIFNDSKGNLWLGTGAGLSLYNRKTDSFTNFQHDPENPKSIGNNKIQSCMLEDHQGNLWFGSWGGLIKMSGLGVFTTYKQDKNKPGSLSNDRVISLCLAKDGTLWIGTHNGGLNKMSVSSDKEKNAETVDFIHFNEKEELTNSIIYGIQEDNNGNLWLSTTKGILKFNPESKSLIKYDVSDGLQSNEFYWGASLKGKNEDLFFGGVNGFNIFTPDSIKMNKTIPEVVITDFQIFNKAIPIGTEGSPLQKHISELDEIILNHEQSVISFEFAALEYSAPEKNNYAYILEGFEKDWNFTGNKRNVSYTHLDPGKYTFKVKASNSDGVWNEKGTSIRIKITPPFWKTWWFKIILAILIISILYGYLLLKLKETQIHRNLLQQKVEERTIELFDVNKNLKATNKKLNRHKENLEAVVEERTKDLVQSKEKAEESDRLKTAFLMNMSHEIRTPMNAIIGFSSMLDNPDLNDELKHKFTHLIVLGTNSLMNVFEEILYYSQLETNQIDIYIEKFSVQDLIKTTYSLKADDLKVLDNENIKLNYSVPEKELIITSDLDRIQHILIFLLSNALTFTEKGQILFGFEKIEAGYIRFFVKDTGIGIDETKLNVIFERFSKIEDENNVKLFRGVGLGLTISKKLVELLGGEIWITSKPRVGTEVFFTIPYDSPNE